MKAKALEEAGFEGFQWDGGELLNYGEPGATSGEGTETGYLPWFG